MHRDGERLRVFSRRAALLGAGQLGLLGLLAGRLYYLQVLAADEYALLADDNRINHRLLPPARGRLFDRNHVPLARNVPTYRVRLIREQTEDVEGTLTALGRLVELAPERVAEILAEVRERRPFVPITVRHDLDWGEVSRIAVHGPDLPGITLGAGLVRDYPAGEATAHALGYVGPVTKAELNGDALLELPEYRHGKSGVEKQYDDVLRGKAGLRRIEVNALGREIKELHRREGEPGRDLQLTLDLSLQRFVHHRLGREPSASAVVLDVHTGEILALASIPTYDPGAFINGLTRASWRSLITDPRAPLLNKAIAGQYPPGSTFKMIVALAALEGGIAGPDHEVYCPGHMRLGRQHFHCWKRWGHGRLRMVEAIAQSCDVYFYDLAHRVGIEAIAAMARRFGLGSRLGIDLPGEGFGLVPDKDWKRGTFGVPWQNGETLVVGIGQGYLQATPLQLAVMTAWIANGGRPVAPWLVHDPAGQPGSERAGRAARIGISPPALEVVRRGMYEVVNGERGTARQHRLDDPEVAMAGKTGTSQVRRITPAERARGIRKNEEKLWEERDHALFVAYAPYREPRYAVAVVVEHGGSGSRSAAPIAREIMTRTLELDPSRRAAPTADRSRPADRAAGRA